MLAAAAAPATAVALGAFGAHAIKTRVAPESFAVYQTAVQYHFWHALGLLGVGMLMSQWPAAHALAWTAWLLIAGLFFFCGSLYALAPTGTPRLGVLTPIGGALRGFAYPCIALHSTAMAKVRGRRTQLMMQ